MSILPPAGNFFFFFFYYFTPPPPNLFLKIIFMKNFLILRPSDWPKFRPPAGQKTILFGGLGSNLAKRGLHKKIPTHLHGALNYEKYEESVEKSIKSCLALFDSWVRNPQIPRSLL